MRPGSWVCGLFLVVTCALLAACSEADGDTPAPGDAQVSDVVNFPATDAMTGPDALVTGDTQGPLEDIATLDTSDAASDVSVQGDIAAPADIAELDTESVDADTETANDTDTDVTPDSSLGPDVEGDVVDVEVEADSGAGSGSQHVLYMTELMRAPAAGSGQWIEVWNPQEEPVSLAGWSVVWQGTASAALQDVSIPAQGVALIAASGATGLDDTTVIADWGAAFEVPLEAGVLALQRADGVVVDSLSLDEGFPVVSGRSNRLDGEVLLDAETSNDAPESWCLATEVFGLGDLGSPGVLNAICTLALCGDGVQQPGEACDDGNIVAADGCEPTCVPTPQCGNGLLEAGEFCDDDNDVVCDGCTDCQVDLDTDTDGALDCADNCVAQYNPPQSDVDGDGLGDVCDFQDCGNTLTEGSETCDDGNLDSGDGCSAGCLEEVYGPGSVVINELMLRPNATGGSAHHRVWVEFFNPGALPVDLAGMSLHDDFGQSVTLPAASPIVVAPGAFGVVAAHADPAVNGGVVDVLGTLAGFAPKPGFGQLEIRWQGTLIDRVGWDPGVLFPDGFNGSIALNPAILGADTPAAANDDGSAWCYGLEPYGAGGLGSPGEANPSCLESYCGDGVVGPAEACDDFNTQDGDGCDLDCSVSTDSDGDAVFDGVDNCVEDFNPNQNDEDQDGIGDTCDVQECGNIVIEGDESCDDGNLFAGDGCSPVCGVESYGAGALVLTEVMASPIGVAPQAGRWIELYNTTTEPVGLGGLRLTDASGTEGLVDPESTAVVAPGHVAVVGLNAVYADNGGLGVQAVADILPLDDGVLSLWWQDVLLDSVAFDEGWPSPEGVAWTLSGLANSATANDDSVYWCPALKPYGLTGNLGSPGVLNDACVTVSCGDGAIQPGEQCDDENGIEGDGCEPDCTLSVDSDGDAVFDAVDNCPFLMNADQLDSDGDQIGDPCDFSLCGNAEVEPGETCDDGGQTPGDGCSITCQVEVFLPGDVIVSEIMVNPTTAIDADGQWFELANLTPVDIDIRGWVISDGLFDNHVVTSEQPVLIPTKGVIVLGLNPDLSSNGGVHLDYVIDDFLFVHGPDAIELTWNSVVIDRVPLEKEGGPSATGGRSLALNPGLWIPGAGAFAENWCAQQSLMTGGDRGSPGEENDPCIPGIVCGDGVVFALTETCDDGVANSDVDADACRQDCTLARCGDGVTDTGESCDDGNTFDGDGCQVTCQQSSLCGNGVLDEGEACDDGALNSDTAPGACRLDCEHSSCGDGVWDPQEGCDDGNLEAGDACGVTCQPPSSCGDGVLDAVEGCDDGTLNSDTVPGACRTDCLPARCGDGVVDPAEGCDDGNFDPADGCEATCTSSPDLDSDGVPDAVDGCPAVADPLQVDTDGDGLGDVCDPPICGNGSVEGDEVCDDGNPFVGDGCSPSCKASLAQPGDLIITEVMQNPDASLDEAGEWFEIVNASAMTWNLAGWRVTDEGEDAFTVSVSLELPPGARAVLGRSADLAVNGGVDVDVEYGAAMLLENGADVIALHAPQGALPDSGPVDRVAWTGAAPWPDPIGASMALEPNLTDAVNNDDGGVWCAATEIFGAGDFGTPGTANGPCVVAACGNGYIEPGEACDDGEENGFEPGFCRPDCTPPLCGDGIVDPGEGCDDGNLTTGDGCEVTCLVTDPDAVCGDNEVTGLEFCDDGNTQDADGCSAECLIESVQSGDVLITEVMILPEGLDPSDGQWFEVLNTTSVPINLNGWRVRDGVLEDTVIQSGQPVYLQPGARGLLVRNGDPAANGGVQALAVLGGVNFALQGDAIEIVWNGQSIDRVAWDSSWNIEGGRTLSLDPLGEDVLQNDLKGVWCSALLDTPYGPSGQNFGTPGEGNPSCPEIALCGDGVQELDEGCDDGNLLFGDGCSAACELESLQPGSVVVAELASRPLASLGQGDWVELYALNPVALGGWVFRVGGVAYTLPDDEPLQLKSGERLLLAASDNVLLNGGVVPDVVLPGLDLQFGLAPVSLVQQGIVIDEVSPASNWLFLEGHSLALDPGAHDTISNDAPEAWCPAVGLYGDGDFGSPGTPNSACPPPVICGNEVQEGPEGCDDGNLIAGDGCEPDCTLTPVAGCGNGVLDDGEACDDGGLASGDGCSLSCQVELFAAGDVVITEIMQNPSAVTDGLGEWFEVYNPRQHPIDLAGWYLTDLGSNAHQVNPKAPLIVAPGGYLVLGIHPDPVINGGVPVDYAYATFSLSNGADAVQLTWQGVLIDAVVYDGGESFPDPIGATMTLDPDAIDDAWNDDGALWCTGQSSFGAGDQGTPGASNDHCPGSVVCGNGVVEGDEPCDDGNMIIGDGCNPDCSVGPLYVCGNEILEANEDCDDGNASSGDGCSATCLVEAFETGDVVFTELMINPASVDDFHGEWVELLNTTEGPIDLAGWSLGDGASEVFFFDGATSLILLPGQRFVIGRDGDVAENGGVMLDYVVPQMSLKNLADTLQLTWDDVVIDRVTWDQMAGWAVPEGASFTLAEGAEDAISNDLLPSWCPATQPFGDGDLGSPGEADTACQPPAPDVGEVVFTEVRRSGPPTAPDYEFIEVYNLAPHTIGLTGLVLAASDGQETTLQGGVVLSGGFAWAAPNLPVSSLGGEAPDAVYEGFALPDAETTLTLRGEGGSVLDTLPIGADFPGLSFQAASLDPAAWAPDDNDTASLWCVAPASPGDAGGCALTDHLSAGTLVISEVRAGVDWAFEITNLTGDEASLLGVAVHVGASGAETARALITEPVVVPSGGQFVVEAQDLPGLDSYVLESESALIRLEAAHGLIVDAVALDASYPWPNEGSIALAPGALTADANDAPDAWCQSPPEAESLGSPNSVCLAIPPEGALVITEIMARSMFAVSAVSGGWVEVANVGPTELELGGLVLRDLGGDFWPIPTGTNLPSGERMVFGAVTNTQINGGADVDVKWSVFSLDPVADEVIIEVAGSVVDAVAYDQADGWPLLDGHSMSLSPTHTDISDNDAPGAWCVATSLYGDGDAGTPGAPNDVCELLVGTVIIAELMPDPINMSDAAGEYIELYNPGPVAQEIGGWRLESEDGDVAILPSPLPIDVGQRLVLGRSADLSQGGGLTPDAVYEGMTLSNTVDDVWLVHPSGLIIDAVAYDVTWPVVAGRSIELLEGSLDHLSNDVVEAWCASAAAPYALGNMGTPGESTGPCD
ncbi:MAG: lamin tail domain-containing protein [Myxococcota bacterium]